MSDLQDLIHKTSMDCIRRGAIAEQERIVKRLQERIEAYYKTGEGSSLEVGAYEKAIELIKGEANGS